MLDAVLLLVVTAMLLVDDATQLFKLVFFLLTIVAFFWPRETFVLRAVFWTALTTAVLVGLLAVDRLPAIELLDIPFAIAVLVLVYLVTSRRDEARRQVDAMLESEQQRSRELADLADLKAEFTAVVVHEFGNPLAAMRRLTEMLDIEGLDDASRRSVVAHAAAALRSEISALDTLVADVQMAVAVDRDDFMLRPRPVAIADLVDDARSYAESLVGTERIRVSVDSHVADHHVIADRERIRQVLRNLLTNAAKHSPGDSTITIAARGVHEGAVGISVADNGPGLDDDELDSIFERFERGRRSRGTDGLGLGLYISRQLVRAHGSELRARSRSGDGTVFSFELEVSDA